MTGPRDTGGSGKNQRVGHLDGGQDGAFRRWSLFSPSAENVADD